MVQQRKLRMQPTILPKAYHWTVHRYRCLSTLAKNSPNIKSPRLCGSGLVDLLIHCRVSVLICCSFPLRILSHLDPLAIQALWANCTPVRTRFPWYLFCDACPSNMGLRNWNNGTKYIVMLPKSH